MDKDSRKKDSGTDGNIDDYIFQEIIDYYGEDIVKSADSVTTTAYPLKRNKRKKFYSALSIVCAVVFLSGTMILSGVLLNIGYPLPENNPSDSHQEIVSSQAEYGDSDSLYDSSDNSSYTSEEFSEASMLSEKDSEIISSSKSSSDISSSEELHSDSINTNSMGSSDLSRSEYSLPEIPDEGLVNSIATDNDNNSTTNPYDNVTTGDVVQAGAGTALMVLSLAAALVLNKMRANEK